MTANLIRHEIVRQKVAYERHPSPARVLGFGYWVLQGRLALRAIGLRRRQRRVFAMPQTPSAFIV
jgi:hypothetical protein